MTNEQMHHLSALRRAVDGARSEVEEARRGKARPGSSAADPAQRSLLAALEQYAAALTRHGRPVPYRLRDELAMYRAMFNIRRSD